MRSKNSKIQLNQNKIVEQLDKHIGLCVGSHLAVLPMLSLSVGMIENNSKGQAEMKQCKIHSYLTMGLAGHWILFSEGYYGSFMVKVLNYSLSTTNQFRVVQSSSVYYKVYQIGMKYFT